MSTFYYLVCDSHRVSTDVVGGRSFPDRWWTDNPESFANFLSDHAECRPHPKLVSEHSELPYEYDRPYDRDEADA